MANKQLIVCSAHTKRETSVDQSTWVLSIYGCNPDQQTKCQSWVSARMMRSQIARVRATNTDGTRPHWVQVEPNQTRTHVLKFYPPPAPAPGYTFCPIPTPAQEKKNPRVIPTQQQHNNSRSFSNPDPWRGCVSRSRWSSSILCNSLPRRYLPTPFSMLIGWSCRVWRGR
jgi:hypothetical protein